jgi:hypothetical protein
VDLFSSQHKVPRRRWRRTGSPVGEQEPETAEKQKKICTFSKRRDIIGKSDKFNYF